MSARQSLTQSEKRRYFWFPLVLLTGVCLALAVAANSVDQYGRLAEFQQRLAATGRGEAILERLYRNLAVNGASAFALLGCLVFLGTRFRYHVKAKRWEEQLSLARAVQSQLIPARDLSCDTVRVAAEFVPAEAVGGDLYDVFPAPEESTRNSGVLRHPLPNPEPKVAFAVGDVSGKNLPAALLMSLIHGALRSHPWYRGAAEQESFAERLNELLCGRTGGARFASLLWGYYDPEDDSLSLVSAGHCPAFIVRGSGPGGGSVEIRRLESGGPVLGLLRLARYGQTRVDFQPGDLFIAYSDGLVEGTDPHGEEFGEERLQKILYRMAGCSAEMVRAEILREYWAFLGTSETEDDLTLLVLEARGVKDRDLGGETVLAAAGTEYRDSSHSGDPYNTRRSTQRPDQGLGQSLGQRPDQRPKQRPNQRLDAEDRPVKRPAGAAA